MKKFHLPSQFQPIHSSIPDDIMLDIFTRLPIRSLMRLSCISKSWHSLISSPNLFKSHYKRCAENKGKKHHKLMLAKVEEKFSRSIELKLFNCSLHSALSCALPKEIDVTTDFIINLPAKCYNPSALKISFSCYGLVFIMIGEENMFLWNPAIRKCRKLPDFAIEKEHKFFGYFSGYPCLSCGIGYDEVNDDFKVLVVSCGGMQHERLAKVYSQKMDSWKKIEDFKYYLIERRDIYFLNGMFHFTVMDDTIRYGMYLTGELKIVSLDSTNGIHKQIELPKEENMNPGWTLGTLQGCLSLMVYSSSNQFNLWLMKEYGVRESWTPVLVIPCFEGPDGNLFSKPFFLSDDGQLLFETWPAPPKLGVYDPNQKSLQYHRFSNWQDFYEAHVFVESLASP